MSNRINSRAWDENELVLRLKKNEEEAYRVLVQKYQEKLLRVAYGITLDREESLEIVQEVFLKVYQNIQTFKGDSKLYSWMRRIAVNQCLNWHRRWKRRFRWHHQPLENGEAGDRLELGTVKYSPETLYGTKELEKALNNGLRAIPENVRTVFVLKEIEGLSYTDIAKLLNIKKGTVSSRIFYARQKLKRSLLNRLDPDDIK